MELQFHPTPGSVTNAYLHNTCPDTKVSIRNFILTCNSVAFPDDKRGSSVLFVMCVYFILFVKRSVNKALYLIHTCLPLFSCSIGIISRSVR